jgi:hypothetical protein
MAPSASAKLLPSAAPAWAAGRKEPSGLLSAAARSDLARAPHRRRKYCELAALAPRGPSPTAITPSPAALAGERAIHAYRVFTIRRAHRALRSCPLQENHRAIGSCQPLPDQRLEVELAVAHAAHAAGEAAPLRSQPHRRKQGCDKGRLEFAPWSSTAGPLLAVTLTTRSRPAGRDITRRWRPSAARWIPLVDCCFDRARRWSWPVLQASAGDAHERGPTALLDQPARPTRKGSTLFLSETLPLHRLQPGSSAPNRSKEQRKDPPRLEEPGAASICVLAPRVRPPAARVEHPPLLAPRIRS